MIRRPFSPTTISRYLGRARKTSENNVTAWWDASQIYGSDEISRRAGQARSAGRASCLLVNPRPGESLGICRCWRHLIDESAMGRPGGHGLSDNWSIGTSFFHNVFPANTISSSTRFAKKANENPPKIPGCAIHRAATNDSLRRRTADELFEAARLVIAQKLPRSHHRMDNTTSL